MIMLINNIGNNELYKYVILNVVKNKFPILRKRVYTDDYYLDMIEFMLNDTVKWKSLALTKIYKSRSKYHYKVINTLYNKWANADVFKISYKIFLNTYYKEIVEASGCNIDTKYLIGHIDCSYIMNKHGRENIGINPEYKKKNVTKISSFTDTNKITIALHYANIKSKLLDNGYNKKTIEHDLLTVQPLFDNILLDTPNKIIRVFVSGDKAYITKTEFTCNNKRVTIITPRKIRSEKQKIKLTKKYNNELKLLEEKILKTNDKITVEVSSLNNEKQILKNTYTILANEIKNGQTDKIIKRIVKKIQNIDSQIETINNKKICINLNNKKK